MSDEKEIASFDHKAEESSAEEYLRLIIALL